MGDWRNWSGSVRAEPRLLARPRDIAELAAHVRSAGKLRVTGAGHSFMPLCATGDTLLSLSAFEGELAIAADRATVWAPAGWGLSRLTAALWDEGLSLINQGDIDAQSVAGAVSTGTHGTGAELGSISTQACGFRVMGADGRIVECGPALEPELFQAMQVSLGLLGVLTEVRLQVLPAYHLEERISRMPVGELFERFDELAAETRHVEFWLFPYADQAILKTLHPCAPEEALGLGTDIEETAFRMICEISAKAPWLVPRLQRWLVRPSRAVSRRAGPAGRIFPSERSVRFEEMEYEVPRAGGLAALKAAIGHIRSRRMPVAFPFEFRLVAGDDIWMSPFHAGPCASVSMHQFAKMPWAGAFSDIAACRAHGGRPHWAKRHGLGPDEVHALYPKAADFLAVRERVDPGQKFANAHMCELFGLTRGRQAQAA